MLTTTEQMIHHFRESNTLEKTLIDNADEALYFYSIEGKLIYVNPAFENITGFTTQELYENNFIPFVHPDDEEWTMKLWEGLFRGEFIEEIEYRIVKKNGDTRWSLSSWKIVSDRNGNKIGIQGKQQDITQRKLAEEELAKAIRMKDEFLANMSHELRTPLNAILSTNEGLQHGVYGSVTAEQQESFEVIEHSGNHLLTLINDVLDLAKIEAGQMELELSTINVSQLCTDSLKLVSPQADLKQIQINLNVSSNLPTLKADQTRISQVLINLLTNAIKYSPKGGSVTLFARQKITQRNDRKEVLQFCVTDNGIGIEADKLTMLFKPFVQIDSSLGRNYQGTGLGLSLVKRFVDLHNGTISVESELGVGSRFTFELPFNQGNENHKPSPAPITPPVLQPNRPENTDGRFTSIISTDESAAIVLLTEDNDNNARPVIAYLKTEGIVVHHADNGVDAIIEAQRLLPDVILMDINLPGMNGFDVIKQLRVMPDVCEIPIIALTGLAMPGDSERCLAAGANEYLSKPYRMSKLVSVIKELMRNDSRSDVVVD